LELYPHRIRLRGPWQAIRESQPATTVRMPCGCGDVWPGFRGMVRFIRHFGIPRKLDDFERVWLTFAGMSGWADVELNGESLGRWETSPFEIEVTGRLRERNELVVNLNCAEPSDGLWGDVALEIRCNAWLRNVTVERQGELLVMSGEAVGRANGPLDLYAILGRATAIQATIAPTESGTLFNLMSAPLSPVEMRETKVRVELVAGAVAWHTQDFTVNLLL